MTYEQFRDHVLDLLNQRSSNGVVLDNLYNDQSDYLIRIPSLYNSAVTDVANYMKYTGVIDHDTCLPEPMPGGFIKINVPDDFIRLLPVLSTVNGKATRCGEWYDLGNHQIAIRKPMLAPGVVLQYVKVPAKLPTVLGADIDMIHLDGTEEQQYAAALYVAARLCLEDNAFAYSSFMNEYDSRVSEFKSRRSAEQLYATDVYGGDSVYGGYGYES